MPPTSHPEWIMKHYLMAISEKKRIISFHYWEGEAFQVVPSILNVLLNRKVGLGICFFTANMENTHPFLLNSQYFPIILTYTLPEININVLINR